METFKKDEILTDNSDMVYQKEDKWYFGFQACVYIEEGPFDTKPMAEEELRRYIQENFE